MRAFSGIVAVALLATACQQQSAELAVEDAWVRLPAVPGRPGAAYFTVRGGAGEDTLLAASTPAAVRAELHETVKTEGGAMSMQPLSEVPVPAGGELVFAPGGKHVMLFDIGPRVRSGERIPLTLSFAGGRVEVEAQVIGAGDPPPQG